MKPLTILALLLAIAMIAGGLYVWFGGGTGEPAADTKVAAVDKDDTSDRGGTRPDASAKGAEQPDRNNGSDGTDTESGDDPNEDGTIHRPIPGNPEETTARGERPATAIGRAPEGQGIRIIVAVTSDGGEPIPGADVTINPAVTQPGANGGVQIVGNQKRLRTDSDGRVTMDRALAESLTIEVAHPGYSAVTRRYPQVSVGTERVLLERVTLNVGATIRGQLVDAATGAAPTLEEGTARFLAQMPDRAAQILTSQITLSAGGARRATDSLRYDPASGEFAMPYVGLGRYTLRIEMDGYAPVYPRITIDAAGDVNLGRVELQPAVTRTLRLLNEQDGSAIAGGKIKVTIVVPHESAGQQFPMRKGLPPLDPTDAEGATTLTAPAGLPLEMEITAEGYPTTYLRRQLDGGSGAGDATAELVIELAQPGTIAGVVRDHQGEAVAGAQVAAIATDAILRQRNTQTTSSAADGSYSLTPIAPGSYTVVATIRVGNVPTRVTFGPIVVRPGETTTVDADPGVGMSLVLTILDPAGNPAAGLTVSTDATNSGPVTATTDASGIATLSFERNSNRAEVTVTRANGSEATFIVEAPAVGRLAHTLRLPPTDPAALGTLVVTLTNVPSEGPPINTIVELTRLTEDGLRAGQSEVVNAATVTFEGLAPGRYQVELQSDQYQRVRAEVEVTAGENRAELRLIQQRPIQPSTAGLRSRYLDDEPLEIVATPLDADGVPTARLSGTVGQPGTLILAVGVRYLITARIVAEDNELWRTTTVITPDTVLNIE